MSRNCSPLQRLVTSARVMGTRCVFVYSPQRDIDQLVMRMTPPVVLAAQQEIRQDEPPLLIRRIRQLHSSYSIAYASIRGSKFNPARLQIGPNDTTDSRVF